ncbi:MAG: hypothetical protein QOE05_3469 [Actinomycetota bacterium]|nr:hypothetical protein [Actinomycetota bacterium]
MFLKCCVNGVRLQSEHPALPVTAAELARDAAQVVAAGADALHVHAKDDTGRDTLDPTAVAAALTAIRETAPGVPVGVTTGAWIDPDPAARVAAIRAWTVLPDFASVNWHESGAEEVAAALLARGVGVEAGLWVLDHVAGWRASPLRDACMRVLVELPEGSDPSGVGAQADLMVERVREGSSGHLPVLLHGEASYAWPALRHAVGLGLQARIGLEDVLTLPDGTPASDNAALIRAARAIGRSL